MSSKPQPTPEQAWLALTKSTARVPTHQVAAVFAALKPATAEFLTRGDGEWHGGDVNTGHPAGQQLAAIKWAGKTFRSPDEVEPVVVYRDDGTRMWNEDWGHARLREMKCGDGNTAAMIYDDFPIIDYFRVVAEDMVAGAMDSKMGGGGQETYYFYLTRMGKTSSRL